MREDEVGMIVVPGHPRQKCLQDLISMKRSWSRPAYTKSQNNQSTRTRDMVVENLSSKQETSVLPKKKPNKQTNKKTKPTKQNENQPLSILLCKYFNVAALNSYF
jgi:hypothetical protein